MDLPKRTTKAPVVIHFGEPVDHALLERMLRVTDAKNRPVPGSVTVGKEERSWSFRPERQWKSGVYRISVPSILEDLAGNNIGKPFDVDLLDRAVPPPTNEVVSLPFAVN
jgi:hypothetical protein